MARRERTQPRRGYALNGPPRIHNPHRVPLRRLHLRWAAASQIDFILSRRPGAGACSPRLPGREKRDHGAFPRISALRAPACAEAPSKKPPGMRLLYGAIIESVMLTRRRLLAASIAASAPHLVRAASISVTQTGAI